MVESVGCLLIRHMQTVRSHQLASRMCWMTYKYRPILGMVKIGGDEDEEKGESDSPLEVVLVERPMWDLKQVRELKETK